MNEGIVRIRSKQLIIKSINTIGIKLTCQTWVSVLWRSIPIGPGTSLWKA